MSGKSHPTEVRKDAVQLEKVCVLTKPISVTLRVHSSFGVEYSQLLLRFHITIEPTHFQRPPFLSITSVQTRSQGHRHPLVIRVRAGIQVVNMARVQHILGSRHFFSRCEWPPPTRTVAIWMASLSKS